MSLLLTMVTVQMVRISPRVTLYAALPLTLGLAVLRMAIRRLMLLFRSAQERVSALEQRVLEGFRGVRVLRDYGADELLFGTFDKENQELLRLRLRVSRIASFMLPVIHVVGNLAIGILLIWAALLVGDEALAVGEIAAYVAYLAMLVGLLFSIGWTLNAVQRGMVSLRRVHEVMPLDQPPPAPLGPPEPRRAAASGGTSLEARDLVLARGGHEILRGLSFRAMPGGHLGILGTVGSGKSSLVRALTALMEPSSGALYLGSRSYAELDPAEVRDRVRAVPDVPFLFTRTLEENIALVDPPGAIDPARVDQALHIAAFDPVAEGLADGKKTLVGEKGVTLSGGQKQRITLARAIYAGGEVLILDDVLSAVDHRTEQTILQRLAKWRSQGGRSTALINISNRVSALDDADEILVLDQGRVVERGSPTELARGSGIYAQTAALQRALEAARETAP